MRQKHNIDPIYDANSKILILGSFPSITSRKACMYYAHPRNRFWSVMSILFNENITDKKEFLLKHNIALWDVVKECEIKASSDASIKNVKVNNIKSLLKKTNIKYIFVLGSKAYSLYNKFLLNELKIKAIKLPSTSLLNAKMKTEDLVDEFKIILDYLDNC